MNFQENFLFIRKKTSSFAKKTDNFSSVFFQEPNSFITNLYLTDTMDGCVCGSVNRRILGVRCGIWRETSEVHSLCFCAYNSLPVLLLRRKTAENICFSLELVETCLLYPRFPIDMLCCIAVMKGCVNSAAIIRL